MKIIQVHNRYRYRGGEDSVVEATIEILKRRGISISLMERPSLDNKCSIFQKIRLFFSGIYSLSAKQDMSRIISKERPDLVHVHNLYPLLSHSILTACRKAGVPVVMTAHNYRLVCPIGFYFRAYQICEKCTGGKNIGA